MGTTYKPTVLVIFDYYKDVTIFGEIHDIISVDQKFYLTAYLFITKSYNPHFHAYEVNTTSHQFICEVSSLRDHHPLWVYQSYDIYLIHTYFIPLKYHVIDNIELHI